MSDFEIVNYADAQHREYVITTFLDCMRATWPWSHVPRCTLEDRFFRELRAPDSKALVATVPDDPGTICGWSVTKPAQNEIVAGYTRRPLRRKWGIGSSLAIAGGVDFEKPVGVWFWTYATERLFREHAGYGRLYMKVTNDRDPNPVRRGSFAQRHQHSGHQHRGGLDPQGGTEVRRVLHP